MYGRLYGYNLLKTDILFEFIFQNEKQKIVSSVVYECISQSFGQCHNTYNKMFAVKMHVVISFCSVCSHFKYHRIIHYIMQWSPFLNGRSRFQNCQNKEISANYYPPVPIHVIST